MSDILNIVSNIIASKIMLFVINSSTIFRIMLKGKGNDGWDDRQI